MIDGIDWLRVILFGVVVVSTGQLLELARFRWRGTLVTGRVIKLEEQQPIDEGGPMFTPIIEYRVDEQRHRIKSVIAMSPPLYRAGHEVPVYYFPSNPGNARVVTAREFVKWLIVIASCSLFAAILTPR